MVLVVLPLACFERTTIGFRLQKLEIHFNASYPGPDTRKGRAAPLTKEGEAAVEENVAAGVSGGHSYVRDGVGGGVSPRLSVSPQGHGKGELEERASVVILTRDR